MINTLKRKLEEQVKIMEKNIESFPFMCCEDATPLLYDNLGLQIVKGFYYRPMSEEYRERALRVWDNVPTTFSKVLHYFSYDPERKLYVDVTAKQFHDSNPSILIMEEGDPRIALREEDINQQTTHYVEKILESGEIIKII